MYPEMRRKDRQISSLEAMEILRGAEYGFLSSTMDDGQSYCVPFNFALEGQSIYLHCSTAPGTLLKNIASDPRVCFSCVGSTRLLPDKFATLYESCVVFGKAALLKGEAERRHGLELLLEKYSPDFPEEGQEYIDRLFELTGVIEIKMEHITGKARRPAMPANLKFLRKE